MDIIPKSFESALKYITKYYSPVSLGDVLADSDGRNLPGRPILVTFDDCYASVLEMAAPLCQKFNVPAVFFINAAFLDNNRLAPDNLVCYVANTFGMDVINAAARTVREDGQPKIRSLGGVFTSFFPAISLLKRQLFLDSLIQLTALDEHQLAADAALYLNRSQLRELTSFGFELGNHTYTHVHGRSLTREDFEQEIDRNKFELETLSNKKVESFSVPYGSSADLTGDLLGHLQLSGHKAVFLSESLVNPRGANPYCLNRVSTIAGSDDTLFREIELLPRLRAIRNLLFRSPERVQASRVQPLNHLGTAGTKN